MMAAPLPPAPRRHARLREFAKFLLIVNLVFCALAAVPLTLAAAFEIQRRGSLAAGPLVWRAFGVSDAMLVGSLLVAAATAPLLVTRRRRALARLLAPPAEGG